MAAAMGCTYHGFSHQEGHLAAVLWSGGHMELMEQRFLAWHLSGGTTELLLVEPGLRPKVIGGTEDLSAGQLIDRTGQVLGLDFPAGKAIDALSRQGEAKPYAIKVRICIFLCPVCRIRQRPWRRKVRRIPHGCTGCLIYAIERRRSRPEPSMGPCLRCLPEGYPPTGSCGSVWSLPGESLEPLPAQRTMPWESQCSHGWRRINYMEHEQLILEVSQVNSYIKEMLDTDGLLGGLCIRGELSNYKKYPSGHHYLP